MISNFFILLILISASAQSSSVREGFPYSLFFNGDQVFVGMPAKDLSNLVLKWRKENGIKTKVFDDVTSKDARFRIDYPRLSRTLDERNSIDFEIQNGILKSIELRAEISRLGPSSSLGMSLFSTFEEKYKEGVVALGEPNYQKENSGFAEYVWEKEGVRYELKSISDSTYLSEAVIIKRIQAMKNEGSAISPRLLALFDIDKEIDKPKNQDGDDGISKLLDNMSDLEKDCMFISKDFEEKGLEKQVIEEINKSPSDWTYYCLAKINEKKGKKDVAVEYYLLSTYYRPSSNTYEKIAKIYASQGKHEKASHYYNVAEYKQRLWLKKNKNTDGIKFMQSLMGNTLLNKTQNELQKNTLRVFEMSSLVDDVDEAIKYRPKLPSAYLMRSQLHYGLAKTLRGNEISSADHQKKSCNDAKKACELGKCAAKTHLDKEEFCMKK